MILNEKVLNQLQKMGFEGLDASLEESLFTYAFLVNRKGQGIIMVDRRYSIKYFGDRGFLTKCIINNKLKEINRVLGYFIDEQFVSIEDCVKYLKDVRLPNLVEYASEFVDDILLPNDSFGFKQFNNDDFMLDLSNLE